MTVKPLCDYDWLREMTIGQLLDLCEPSPSSPEAETIANRDQLDQILSLILDAAEQFYDDISDDIARFAAAIAYWTINPKWHRPGGCPEHNCLHGHARQLHVGGRRSERVGPRNPRLPAKDPKLEP
jgi:hypothetical protein